MQFFPGPFQVWCLLHLFLFFPWLHWLGSACCGAGRSLGSLPLPGGDRHGLLHSLNLKSY